MIPQSAVAFGALLFAIQMAARLVRLLIGEPADDEESRRSFSVE